MKIFLAGLGILISFSLLTACASHSLTGRTAVIDYLKVYNQIDYDLTDTWTSVIESIAS